MTNPKMSYKEYCSIPTAASFMNARMGEAGDVEIENLKVGSINGIDLLKVIKDLQDRIDRLEGKYPVAEEIKTAEPIEEKNVVMEATVVKVIEPE